MHRGGQDGWGEGEREGMTREEACVFVHVNGVELVRTGSSVCKRKNKPHPNTLVTSVLHPPPHSEGPQHPTWTMGGTLRLVSGTLDMTVLMVTAFCLIHSPYGCLLA